VAIALDASSPAAVGSSGATTTTVGFTPPVSSVIVAMVQADANNGNNGETVAVSDSATGTWNTAVMGNGNGGAVSAIFWRPCPTSPGNITVSCTDSFGAVAKRLVVQVWTGTDQTNPIGAVVNGTTAGVSYTSTVDNSQGVSCGLTANATLTAGGSGNTLIDTTGGFDSGDAVFTLNKTALTTTAGTTVTLTIAGTATIAHHVAVELVPPAAATIPYNPQRTTPTRDPGEAWWIQRDRRDANTVATAANPLPSPLDSAWQAGSRYWHLYGDAADAAARTWQSLQRNTASDPSLLTPATAVQYCPPRQTASRDYGEIQWAQRRPTDPSLLATALLENELLGGAGMAQRANTAATNAPRLWTPQQPQREGYSPGLLDQAELEGVLLGGAESAKRNLPATHADRREGPQQRLYISDPSFYPTTAPTDPLTLAWGAGGTYWLIYNVAALNVDRREAPQQRRYISDPGLLATALLENELLVGNRRHGTWFARPISIRGRAGTGILDIPADPLQLTADLLLRILLPATHADRRQAGQQRPQLVDQSAPRPPVSRATSTPTVAARRTSTDAVSARRTSTNTTTDRRTSTPDVEG